MSDAVPTQGASLSKPQEGGDIPSRPPPVDADNRELAQEIVAILREQKIHPVLTFGTGGSGKTMALQSLLHYARARTGAKLAIRRGLTIWPKDHSAYDSVENAGRIFLDSDLDRIASGKLPERTQREIPFFVPVDIENDRGALRLAFLEGMGEWYERETPMIGSSALERNERSNHPFRAFKQIVQEVLATFEYGVSIIFVAPCADPPDLYGQTMEYSHLCLANAMREVERLRVDRSRDNLLFLASKWDAICDPDRIHGRFSDATADYMAGIVQDWGVWTEFTALTRFPKGAKAAMPHASAWVRGETVLKQSQHQAVFERFHRTLWNWLHGNAQVAFLPGSQRARPVLYPDVVPAEPQTMKLYERVARLMTLDARQ